MPGRGSILHRSQKIAFNGLGQGFGYGVGQRGGLLCAGFPVIRVASDEDAGQGKIKRRLNVRDGVADDDAVGRRGLRKIAKGLLEQAGRRFSAIALVLVMGAVVEGIDVRRMIREPALEFEVQGSHIVFGIESQSNTSLVGDHDNGASGSIEGRDGLFSAGKWVEVAPSADVLSFRRLAIDDSIAIEKHVLDAGEGFA